jgi:5'-3' exonuclease
VIPDLLVLESHAHRPGYLVPGVEQGPERVLDLVLAGTGIVGDGPIGVLDAPTQLTDLALSPLPRVFGRLSIVVVRLHLLDGTYELFRAHYGRKDTVLARDGSDARATLGIMESTLGLLREPGVTHLAASFDTVIESFRNLMFLGYKSSAGVDPDLLAQFPNAERALEAIGVVVWRNIEFEADDAIATAAVRWVDDVDQVVICTPDKDLTQVVLGDRIVEYNRREQKILDEEAVFEKFGVRPESIPDYLALVGDAADGVPGIPGWGAKSAGAVLARYGRIEMIPLDPTDWEVTVRGADRLAATLAERIDDAYLYRDLTTLRLDVPIEEELADLEWRGVPAEPFREFCAEFGFDPEAFRIHRWA